MNDYYEESTFSIWQSRVLKTVGVVVSLVAIICGITACILSTPTCILAGIFQIIAGLMVLIFEMPFLFRFVAFTTPVADFAEARSMLQKGIAFCVGGTIPIIMCATASTGIGSGLILLFGIVYIVMSIRGSRNTNENIDNVPNDTMGGVDGASMPYN
ncbi:hypothetical protein A3Q56_04588 [Intoshia linei]|uniref:Calcium channel flower n=1 Tax=Intoshia linei TaxID=1819745 RepID=A0A177B221_9BILA|nr:hypothetical protein A3Q56_04588 [Intoshia linei]